MTELQIKCFFSIALNPNETSFFKRIDWHVYCSYSVGLQFIIYFYCVTALPRILPNWLFGQCQLQTQYQHPLVCIYCPLLWNAMANTHMQSNDQDCERTHGTIYSRVVGKLVCMSMIYMVMNPSFTWLHWKTWYWVAECGAQVLKHDLLPTCYVWVSMLDVSTISYMLHVSIALCSLWQMRTATCTSLFNLCCFD